jgi:hypothetical protein
MDRKPKSSFTRIAGVAGIGFASLIVLANIPLALAGLPNTGAEITEVTAFFSANGRVLGLSSAFGPLIWLLATVFGAGVVAALWQSERERREAWSLAGFAGILLQNVTITGMIATRLALGRTAGEDESAAIALWALHDGLFTLNGTFLALALTGLSIGGLRSGLIGSWLARAGLVAAALQFASATLAPLIIERESPLGLIGLAGWLIWVGWLIAYGVTLFRLPIRPVTMSAARTAAA